MSKSIILAAMSSIMAGLPRCETRFRANNGYDHSEFSSRKRKKTKKRKKGRK